MAFGRDPEVWLLKVLWLLFQMQLQKGVVAVNGPLAYVSQQAWIFHGNVRENILFGEKYNHQRYDWLAVYPALHCLRLSCH